MAAIVAMTFTPDGRGHCLYHEAIDLHELGTLECRRASRVEFSTSTQEWEVRLPDEEETLFSSTSRQKCLDWERDYFDRQSMPTGHRQHEGR